MADQMHTAAPRTVVWTVGGIQSAMEDRAEIRLMVTRKFCWSLPTIQALENRLVVLQLLFS